MSNSHAKTGGTAAKAGASTGGKAAVVEAENAKKPTETPASEVEKTPESEAKTPETPAETSPETSEITEKALELATTVVNMAAAGNPAPTGETTTIKLLRSHPKVGAWPGEQTTIGAELAAELIAGEFAEEVAE